MYDTGTWAIIFMHRGQAALGHVHFNTIDLHWEVEAGDIAK